MPELPVAFLNCKRLFPSDKNARDRETKGHSGPKVEKIEGLAQMLKNLGLSSPPTFICLCELGDATLGVAVASQAFPKVTYAPLWGHTERLRANETGLLILYDVNAVQEMDVQRDRPLRTNREWSRWLAAKFAIKSQPANHLWLIVNHWHSGIHNESDGEYGRRRSSEEISNLYRGMRWLGGKTDPKIDCWRDKALILGDFNCEPTDKVFHLSDDDAWRVSPNINAVINGPVDRPCFYNPMVKAPNVYGTLRVDSHGLTMRMFDHFLVSRSLCQNAGLRYRRDSLVVSEALKDVSDHSAIGAVLDY